VTHPLYYDPAALGQCAQHAGAGDGPVDERIVLSEDVAHHALRVRRHGEGEPIELSDGNGLRAHGVLEAGGIVRLSRLEHEPAPTPALVLAQALAKGDRDLQGIEAATEVGVDEVIPFQAQRSIVRWPAQRRDKAAAKWSQRLHAAGMQSRRTRIPRLAGLSTAGEIASRAAEEGALLLVLHESATEPLTSLDPAELGQARRIVFVVGPEGGLHPDELEVFSAVPGARIVKLGPTVLRASTAGPVACALLQERLGRWG
jgi:16S rRNA (uracil1498-N3)-methyltransferase